MGETWHVRTQAADGGAYDGDSALAWDCPFAIYNGAAGHAIDVRDLYVELAHCTDISLGMIPTFTVERLTAMAGGEALTPQKYSSASGDLPSQVSIVRRPDRCTPAGTYRRFTAISMLKAGAFVSTFNFPRTLAHLGRDQGVTPLGGVVDVIDAANEQPFVLREGEGLGLYCTQGGTPIDMRTVLVLNVGTASYIVPGGFSHAGVGRCVVAIFNGSGSGVVLELRSWLISEEVEADLALPKYRLLKGRMSIVGGDDLTAFTPNAANPALPAGLLLRRSCAVRLPQAEAGPWWLPEDVFERTARFEQFATVYAQQRVHSRILDWQRVQRPPFADSRIYFDAVGRSAKSGMVLRQGEGLAVVWAPQQNSQGVWGARDVFSGGYVNHDFVATFTRAAAGVPPGYPQPGDVDSGVAYDDALVGTLVQPATSDVRLGTGYGAGGTEFTGTLDPGAGGGGAEEAGWW